MKVLAIITARGGSKRIPRKNIKNFAGQPIIKYSIDAALQSGVFTEVMVSTDDEEIAQVARECGALVPFMRSEATSNDFAITVDVLEEVINTYKQQGKTFDYFCCIYPTAPFISADKLKQALEKLINTGADTIFPVARFSEPVLWSLDLEENGQVKARWPEYLNVRSQDLKPAYYDAGQFYFFKTDVFDKKKEIFTDFSLGIEIPESEVQDIDNEEDWKIAELKYNILKRREA